MKLFRPLDRMDDMKLFQIAEKLAHKHDAELSLRDSLYLNYLRKRILETDITSLYGSWTIYAEVVGKYIYIEQILNEKRRNNAEK